MKALAALPLLLSATAYADQGALAARCRIAGRAIELSDRRVELGLEPDERVLGVRCEPLHALVMTDRAIYAVPLERESDDDGVVAIELVSERIGLPELREREVAAWTSADERVYVLMRDGELWVVPLSPEEPVRAYAWLVRNASIELAGGTLWVAPETPGWLIAVSLGERASFWLVEVRCGASEALAAASRGSVACVG